MKANSNISLKAPQITISKDYNKFSFFEFNRPTGEKHIKTLTKSMDKIGFLIICPIVVTFYEGVWYVLDGQHRLRAAQMLGIDFYFIVDPQVYKNEKEIRERIRELNDNHKGWSQKNALESYCKMGYPEYILFNDFLENNNFSIALGLRIMRTIPDGTFWGYKTTTVGPGYTGSLDSDFKGGRLVFSKWAKKYEEIAEHIRQIRFYDPIYDEFNKSPKFMRALVILNTVWWYDHEDMMKNLSKTSAKITQQQSANDYLTKLQAIYNNYKKKLYDKEAYEEYLASKNPFRLTKEPVKVAAKRKKAR